MIKRLLLASALFCFITSNAQAPVGYYDSVKNKNCKELKSTLKSIITNGHTAQGYGDLWDQYKKTDTIKNPSGNNYIIWDMYSFKANGTADYYYTPGTDQCGSYNSEADCYNREHSFPASWFNDEAPAYTDYNHLFPTDGWVNNKRSNYRFGEVASPSYTSSNGSKLGSSATAGINGTVFEPIDMYKGDFARAYLYMVTRYQNRITTWYGYNTDGALTLSNDTFPSVNINYLKLMLKWHNQDPVSEKERYRNNGTYNFQGNRNPYIDSPQYVTRVWNSTCSGLAALPINIVLFSGKLKNGNVFLTWQTENAINFNSFNVERSFNGKDYTAIGTVPANNKNDYSFTDNEENIRGRRVYYRLKQIDNDGSFQFSEVFSIHIPLNSKYTIYPNPAMNFIIIEKTGINNNLSHQIQLTDLAGKILISKYYANANSQIILPIQHLPNGTYILRFTAGNESFIQKIVKRN
ncbi:MAG TPA: endonuclease [Chitinophagaceae bacterium]|nr:endonuclease [Chitinophagaceae bacterium]MCC6634702.1 endonuclease [Chitinophagaceae bacterium]HMZ45521.1 endonuclease [Chitinophagaceae bacterium]HNE92857.1 endonuclease [Chitinophagaceae bacterium]HNJ57708.1 endonuclease [Chitinophagaceae bacterium]